MDITLESLGFTKEELQERVIDRICDQLLSGVGYDPDSDEEFTTASQFHRALQARIKEQINATISAIAEREVLPNVASYVENLTLQATNQWGEKKGEPVSFTEYLVQRAQAYMQEKVDYNGKAKEESGGYSWSGTQTRITYLVNSHLHHSIETAMKQSLQVGLGEVAKGIHETARLKLNEIAASMKVQVTPK